MGTGLVRIAPGLLLATALAAAVLTPDPTDAAPEARQDSEPGALDDPTLAFVARYCFECHSAEIAEGEIDLEAAPVRIEDPASAELWTQVIEVLDLEEMPPRKAELHPDDAEREAIVQSLTTSLAAWQENAERGRTILRRLNSDEFANALRDLFGIPLSRDLVRRLPEDEEDHGFTVVGQSLRMTENRLEAVLDAALELADAATLSLEAAADPDQKRVLGDGANRWELRGTNLAIHSLEEVGPPTERMRAVLAALEAGEQIDPESLRGPTVTRNPRAPSLKESYLGLRPARYQLHAGSLVTMKVASRASVLRTPAAECGTPNVALGGRYRYSVRAGTIRDPEDKLSIRIGVRTRKTKREESSLPGVRTLQLAPAVPIEEAGELTGFVWLTAGERLVVQSMGDLHIGAGMRQEDVPGATIPGLVVEAIDLEPATDPRFMARRAGLFGPSARERASRRAALRELLHEAWRRPITDEEVAHLDGFYHQASVDAGTVAHVDAMADLLATLLVAPDFLYLRESSGALDAHALATRLALLLWRSLPDLELLEAAGSGELLQPDSLWAQAERMLADPRALRFRHDFLDQWLELVKFGQMEPDQNLYPDWNAQLERSLREQTRRFFGRILEENRPLIELVASDWTMLDATLGRHYGIPAATSLDLAVVELTDEQRQRGGILGMGSVMNLTTNGTVTSPVLRGVWVLERILGRYPDPPPPEVEPIEPDIRGTTTLLEQLERHRSLEACAGCHDRIDPFGIPLEEFDVLGAKRERYMRVMIEVGGPGVRDLVELVAGAEVVKSAVLLDGTPLDGVADLQAWLAANPEPFVRAFTGKLLTFATGRVMRPGDRAGIDAVVQAAGGADTGLRALLEQVVRSELFRGNG